MNRRLAHDWFDRPLPANVEFGDRSWLHSAFAFLHYASRRPRGLTVGHDTGLYKGTFFDLGPDAEVRIGDYCTCVSAIISTRGRVSIGDYVFIAHDVVIADDEMSRPTGAAANDPAIDASPAAPIVIEDDVWIGAKAIVLGGAVIGAGAIVGAGTLIRDLVPPGAIVAGCPARIVGWTPGSGESHTRSDS